MRCPTDAKRITKTEAVQYLKDWGMKSIPKRYKHAEDYFLFDDLKKYKSFWNSNIKNAGTQSRGYFRRNKDGLIMVGIPARVVKPKLIACAKCGTKYPIANMQRYLSGKQICADCQKMWVEASNRYAMRWLKGQSEAFVFR